MAADLVVTGVGPGVTTTGFTNASIAANRWLYLDISDVTGTIEGLAVTVNLTV
jgi:hypothetical protein